MALNTARCLTKLGGVSVKPIVRVGKDVNSEFILSELRSQGFSRETIGQCVVIDDEINTPTVVCLSQEGEHEDRAFIVGEANRSNPSDYGIPRFEDIRERVEIICDCAACHFTCVGIANAFLHPEIGSVMRSIKRSSTPPVISADAVFNRNLADARWQSSIYNFLKEVDFFLPSDVEASQLTGLPPTEFREAADRIRVTYELKGVCVKLHERGVYCLTDDVDCLVHPQTSPKHKIVQTTGAGDAWCAGFLHALVACGLSAIQACVFANHVAGYFISSTTGFDAIPSGEAIEREVHNTQQHDP